MKTYIDKKYIYIKKYYYSYLIDPLTNLYKTVFKFIVINCCYI